MGKTGHFYIMPLQTPSLKFMFSVLNKTVDLSGVIHSLRTDGRRCTADIPPSTTMVAPFTNREPSPDSHRAHSAISAGSPKLPAGYIAYNSSRSCGAAAYAACDVSVLIVPGQMALA